MEKLRMVYNCLTNILENIEMSPTKWETEWWYHQATIWGWWVEHMKVLFLDFFLNRIVKARKVTRMCAPGCEKLTQSNGVSVTTSWSCCRKTFVKCRHIQYKRAVASGCPLPLPCRWMMNESSWKSGQWANVSPRVVFYFCLIHHYTSWRNKDICCNTILLWYINIQCQSMSYYITWHHDISPITIWSSGYLT